MAADYWLVKRGHIDIPALYNPRGRYRYMGGCNWRAALAFIIPVAPLLPGLALSISGDDVVHISDGDQNLYTFNWLFGFVSSIVIYTVLSFVFPAPETILSDTIWNLEAIEGVREGSDIEKSPGSVTGSGKEDEAKTTVPESYVG